MDGAVLNCLLHTDAPKMCQNSREMEVIMEQLPVVLLLRLLPRLPIRRKAKILHIAMTILSIALTFSFLLGTICVDTAISAPLQRHNLEKRRDQSWVGGVCLPLYPSNRRKAHCLKYISAQVLTGPANASTCGFNRLK